MIDLAGLPLPDGGPEPGSCVRVERPEGGLLVLVLDPPHRERTVLDLFVLRDLDLALDEAEREIGLRGLVVTGREPLHFAYGADIDAIESVTDPELVKRVVRIAHGVFDRLARQRDIVTVAAVGGPTPGGAYELSLACDFIVAADDDSTRIGLPETKLGIVPGWGGCHRLPKRIGVVAALPPILTGRLYRAKQAKRIGMIDRITKAEYLSRVAADIALGRERLRKRKGGAKRWLVDKNPLAMSLIASKARGQVIEQTGGRYPAPLAAIDLVTDSAGVSAKDVVKKEAAAIARLATGPVCKSLVSIFRASEESKKLGRLADGSKPDPILRGGVVGGGVMGGAIASVMAEKGTGTRLADLSASVLDEALIDHRAEVTKKWKKRRLETHARDAAIDRLDTCVGTVGFGRVQIVVEAVAERIEVKRAVFGDLAAKVPADAILATNTSSLSVDAIADGLPNPERFVGMHFFNPVRKMPLVEIVRGAKTSDEVVRRTAAFALRLGKTPVVVKDVAGFLVNRVLGPYLDEALRLFEGGVFPARLERLLEGFGMPMGPLRLLDEVGFDIASHAAASLHEAYGVRMTPTSALDGMVSEGRLGAKSGRGFYVHPKTRDKDGPKLADDLGRFKSSDRLSELTDEEVIDRCVLSMLNEAVRCLEVEVVETPMELDLATVFGTGFAPFRGGLLHYADSIGAERLVERLREIASAPDVADRPGGPQKFTPAGRLVEMAENGRRFFD